MQNYATLRLCKFIQISKMLSKMKINVQRVVPIHPKTCLFHVDNKKDELLDEYDSTYIADASVEDVCSCRFCSTLLWTERGSAPVPFWTRSCNIMYWLLSNDKVRSFFFQNTFDVRRSGFDIPSAAEIRTQSGMSTSTRNFRASPKTASTFCALMTT